jgi:hypothetical protein
MKKPIHRLLLPALLLSCSPLAFAGTVTVTTINFNPNGTTITNNATITNQYAGATFTNATEATLGNFDSMQFPVASGSSGEIFDSADPIGVSFSGPVNYVSGLYSDPFGIVVTAFSANGTVLGTFDGAPVLNGDDIFAFGASSDIASITISDAPGQLAEFGITDPVPDFDGISQLTFAQTPEPGSFLMLGTGLLTMAGVLRRKFAR